MNLQLWLLVHEPLSAFSADSCRRRAAVGSLETEYSLYLFHRSLVKLSQLLFRQPFVHQLLLLINSQLWQLFVFFHVKVSLSDSIDSCCGRLFYTLSVTSKLYFSYVVVKKPRQYRIVRRFKMNNNLSVP